MKLQQNVGTIDRLARLALAAALGALFLTGTVGAPLSYLVAVIAVAMFATGLSGFCPIYALFRIRTCPIQRT